MMDKEYFKNGRIAPPQPLQLESMAWNWEQSFLDPNSSKNQYSHLDTSLSSIVSSRVDPTSNEAFLLRELIGKLGGIGTAAATFNSPASAARNRFTNDSCYSSPPELDQINILSDNNHNNNFNLGNSTASPPPSLAADPGFVQRATKFSCFGSRSFNGPTSPFGPHNNAELLPHRSVTTTPLMGNGKLPRVCSSTSLKQPMAENKISIHPSNGTASNSDKKMNKLSANSNEESSSVSEQIPSGETGSKTLNDMISSRKRKVFSKGKSKEDAAKSPKGDEEGNAKRCKENENEKNEMKTEDEKCNDEIEKQKANNQKPTEPPKDYIHVRARRGQATDSHSLAERVRREKISERMKLLQDLVPGCNKVTGKALMLDEIINYVQSLQRQVEFLSMKLASVNPGLDFNMDTLLSNSRDMLQKNTPIAAQPQQMYPLDSSTPTSLFSHHQNVQLQNTTNACRGPLSQYPMDPLHLQLPSIDGFWGSISKFPAFGEDDLHSIVQMGFGQNLVNFSVPNQTSDMKVER